MFCQKVLKIPYKLIFLFILFVFIFEKCNILVITILKSLDDEAFRTMKIEALHRKMTKEHLNTEGRGNF